MPSFDIVSELDLQEVDNAVNMVVKEIATRFDFKGGKSSLSLDKASKKITIVADDELKLRAMHQMLEQRLVKRGLDLRCLDYGKQEEASNNAIRQIATLKDGIDKENAKKIIKVIKESNLKVQAQNQDEQVRVTGKKIDDLQDVIQLLRGHKDVGVPLQFVNMRS